MEVKPAKNLGAPSWARWAEIRPKINVFGHFHKLGSLVFLGIEYNNSLKHGRGETHGKNFRGPKVGPKSRFLQFSQGYIISFPRYCKIASWDNV